ncbi:MAG: glutathione S-transferase family protein [Parvibaculaceae bacterium]|nr:glutathione S-transferase family protein [Parvibaculaceae bacterium]
MKLYNSVGPNPHVVRMFMKEKGIELPLVEIDLMGGENRREPYLAFNPAGQLPALELDDGSVLTEITAICEYLDEKFPGSSLIGVTPEERAEARRWTRRVDLNVAEPLTNGFRFSLGLPMFESRVHCIPQAAEDLKAIAQEKLGWIDGLIEGRTFLAGEKLTLADILLFCFLSFGVLVGQPLNPENRNIAAWYERMSQRPSAAA